MKSVAAVYDRRNEVEPGLIETPLQRSRTETPPSLLGSRFRGFANLFSHGLHMGSPGGSHRQPLQEAVCDRRWKNAPTLMERRYKK